MACIYYFSKIMIPKITISQKPTYQKIAEDIDPILLFRLIERQFDTCFMFESLGENDEFSRYTVLGFDPQQIIRGTRDSIFINNREFKVPNPYYALRKIMPVQTLSRLYAGGLVGYLAYDAVSYLEPSLQIKMNDEFDPFMFGVYTDGLVIDKTTNECFYFYYDTSRLEALHNVIANRAAAGHFTAKFLGESSDRASHHEMVKRVKQHIRDGNTFQCEVGFRSEYRISGDTFAIYEKLRTVNPSPFMYYVKLGDKKIIGASPELLFSLRNGEMITRPLAGTVARGKTEAEDTKLARKLLNDTKEIAEHTMLVDLHRNDVGRVARFGSVRIRDLMSIKKFSHVQHISSEIVGAIKPGEDMFSALASNFPMGTVSGAPKVETIKIIDQNEPVARGPYGGGVGHFGFNGDCTFALAIRSLFLNGEHGYTQTCSGIVADSDAENEYAEVQRKLAALRKVLQ